MGFSESGLDGQQPETWHARRMVNRFGRAQVQRMGLPRHIGSDYFHRFLRARWSTAFAALSVCYVIANLGFAAGYLALGDAIQGARPGSLVDAFFFSLQTMATVGYGQLHPLGVWANALASIEAFIGLLGFAIGAALVFAKFSRPTAKIVFSSRAVVHDRDGQRSLVFRVANERNNQILDASLSATLIQTGRTAEGEALRRMTDMKLVRSRTPVFALTWTAVHPIDSDSPLAGLSVDDLRAREIEVIVTFTGLDDSFSQNIHARHSYVVEEIEWGRRLEDILLRADDGRVTLDFRKFHQTREG